MRRLAYLLSCAALLTVFGPPGRAFARQAPPKMAAQKLMPAMPAAPQQRQEDLVVQQFQQQFGAQFRQLYRTEMHFMRLVSQPTKQQYDKIAADMEPALKAITRIFALQMHGLQRGAAVQDQSDPRKPIADELAKSVRANLPADKAAKYEKELQQRAAARKKTVVVNMVAMVDKVLVLTPDQRDKLADVFEKNWTDSWHQLQYLMYGRQYFPQMPDAKILPLLTEAQKVVWRGIPKGNVRFGFNMGNVPGVDLDDEVWDEPRDPGKAKAAEGKEPEGKPVPRVEGKQ
jgi:hypothetical protein